MTMKLGILAGASAALALGAAGAAQATVCMNTDITPTALDCSGFFSGNLLNNNKIDVAAQKMDLAAIGFTWDGKTVLEKLSPLNGASSADFKALLTGISYIGVHYGNGVGGPGNATAFYKLDAGTGLHDIGLNFNASSDAVLYSTGPSGVPEPATWSVMLLGFGALGAAMRRSRRVSATA